MIKKKPISNNENSDSEKYDVFLSHCHIDAGIVESLASKLEDEAAIHVWLDKWLLIPGEHWQQEMAKGIDCSKTCAICIGTETPAGWFKEEIQRALHRQTMDVSFRVIPILLPNAQKTNVDDFLELRTWVEFKSNIDDEEAFHILKCGIEGRPPGRFKKSNHDSIEILYEKLGKLKTLANKKLIDVDISKEWQNKIIAQHIKL